MKYIVCKTKIVAEGFKTVEEAETWASLNLTEDEQTSWIIKKA